MSTVSRPNRKCFIADILCMLELPRIVSGSLVLASPAFRTLFISVIKSFFLSRLSAWRLLSRTTLIRLHSFRCLLSRTCCFSWIRFIRVGSLLRSRFGAVCCARFWFAFTLFLSSVLLVQTGQAILSDHIFVVIDDRFLWFLLGCNVTQVFRFYTAFVHLGKLFDFCYIQRDPVFRSGKGKPHRLLEDIGLLQECHTILCFYTIDIVRNIFEGIHIAVQLVVEAAFQFATLTRQLQRV